MEDYLLDIYLELKNNYKTIKNTYNLLSIVNDLKIPTHSAGQWLLDNMYIVEQEYTIAATELAKPLSLNLPNVKPTEKKSQLRALFMATEIVENNSGVVDDGIVSNYIKEFQRQTYLSFNELAIMPIMLRVALVKFVKRICLNISSAEFQKIKVEKKICESLECKEDKTFRKTIKGIKKLKKDLIKQDGVKVSNTAYIEYMAFRLKDMGLEGDEYLKDLKEETNKVGYTIDEAIEKEHNEVAKTTSLISNAISSMKNIALTNWEEVIVNINRIDETLINDYTGEYDKCDHKTKGRYRQTVIYLAKKYNVSEMYIAKKAVECSEKYKKHIGHFLIGEDKDKILEAMNKSSFFIKFKKNILRPLKSIMYIEFVLLFGAIATILIDKLYTSSYILWQRILIDIVIFSFGMEVGDKIISYVITKFVRPKFLPRFNFAKTIESEYSTVVAMPTVINSIDKIDKMVRKMEITYLANRSKNMYYVLLGDCIGSNEVCINLDQKLINHGNKLIEELNAKYPSSPKLFNYIYRKRVYSKGESIYMGWERKRGALTELNKLLLGLLSQEDIDKAMYITHQDLPKAKYVITIDEDTALSLNAAKELVAIISHPLNKAVLSTNQKIVKSGYGLIQPAIGLDIEAANNSIFSKVFGGFGGLDIYTNAVSNIYQDVFEEAIYTGKGIYDIEIFEKVLGDKMPENLILSHDLLEGSFLRTGLASDVEVQDGFPSNFIAYMNRNHRWYRGDLQIIKWLFSFRCGLNLLSRWKIFDNIRRESLDALSSALLVTALFMQEKMFAYALLTIFVTLNMGYLLSIFDQIIFGKNAERKLKQYIPVIFGLRANLLKMVFNVITVPYRAWIVAHAYFTSTYRMCISKKKLLQWATAENIDNAAKEKIGYFARNMWANIAFSIILLIYVIEDFYISQMDIFVIVMACFFLIAPYAAYIMSRKVIFEDLNVLSTKEEKEILKLGLDTWLFFENTMNELNNFLPPDNLQENRRPKVATRTSPTNIGMGILAILNAYDLKYISLEIAIEKTTNVMNTIKKLKKWNGHLYNWYNIRTLEIMSPKFISTVDSGNFIASMKILKQFLVTVAESTIITDNIRPNILDLLYYTEEYLRDINFESLYSKSRNLFSIGFNVEENEMTDSYYDLLMSESRTTSLMAIASTKVTSKHWFSLARNLVKIDKKKGLLSWSGTSFEYLMPNLFMKSYKYTLIDESLNFSIYSQRKYSKAKGLPWGISESAFAVQDLEQNYQYKAFGIPWLGLKRGLNENMVISPYASLMCLTYKPKAVYKNIQKLKEYGMYSNYGLFESLDFTKKHIGKDKKFEVVKTYMAHHQGMILTAINNYINKDIVKERFHGNLDIAATEILLKERMPLSIPIKENISSKYNKFIEADVSIYSSYISYIDQKTFLNKELPAINIHTNGKFSTMVLGNGINYLYYNGVSITKNRYISNKTLGNTTIFTDKSSRKIWSATYEPNYLKPEEYWISSSLGTTEYYRKDGVIETRTIVCVSPEYNMEIKRYTLRNSSNKTREIVINTEIDLALTSQDSAIIHPAFNDLLIEEYFDNDLDALIAKRRSKDDTNKEIYVFSKLVGIDLAYEVETEKSRLSESGGKYAYDSNISRYPLSPVMSYRARILLDPNEVQSFYVLTGASDTKYNISNMIVNSDTKTLENQIDFALQKENINAKYLKLEKGKAALYNNILSEVLFKTKIEKDKRDSWNENYSKSMLWKFGISGDIPILTTYIGKIEDYSMVKEIIRFMDFVKSRKFDMDIVILVDEELYTGEPIKTQLLKILEKVFFVSYTIGNIYVVNLKQMSKAERNLFVYVSDKTINSIEEFIPKQDTKNDENDLMEGAINE